MENEWSDCDCETVGSDGKSEEEKKRGGGEGGGGFTINNPKERHKLAERQRRKSMRDLFLSLHALLPHSASVRKEQSAILDEIIKYIPLASSRLQSLRKHKQKQRDSPSSSSSRSNISPLVHVLASSGANSSDFDIRVQTDSSSSVSIRVRGDRVNLSLSDTKGTALSFSLPAILDDLESYHLQLLRSTHLRDGSKLLHHSESKVCDGLERSPALLKERLQELACKLHKLRKSSSLKRSFSQLD